MQKGGCMRDYTHVIAVCFVEKMNEYRRYSESERIVITYGLEIFLNNFIKLIIYLITGFMCNIFSETIIAIVILGGLRILSGGYHSQSDLGCLLLPSLPSFLLPKHNNIQKCSLQSTVVST